MSEDDSEARGSWWTKNITGGSLVQMIICNLIFNKAIQMDLANEIRKKELAGTNLLWLGFRNNAVNHSILK